MSVLDRASLRPLVAVMLINACSGDDPQVSASLSFTPTETAGPNPSALDPLAGQKIDFTITLDGVGVVHDTSGTCKELTLFVPEAGRTARGSTSTTVEREIFTKLVGWDIALQLCDDPAQSQIRLESAVDDLNSVFGCTSIPTTAQVRDADGFPLLETFTATRCSATILDVTNNRVLDATGFTIAFTTGPATVP